MTTAIGQFRHVVSLVQPGAAGADPDGGWGETWAPLTPSTWHCSIQAASLRDLQRLSGGVLSTTATHLIRGRYHPGLTRTSRIYFGDRVFDVESVHDQDERRIEVEVIAHEQLGADAVAPPTVPYADQVIADGATHYWRLADLGGTIAIDAKGFAHGTISGGVTLNQPGAIMDANAAMAFNGTTGKIVTVGNVAIPAFWSCEAWIRTSVAVGELAFLATQYPWVAGQNTFFFVCHPGGSLACTVYDDVASSEAINFDNIADNAWHHIVWVFPAPATVNLYIDGTRRTLNTEVTRTLTGSTSKPFEIGVATGYPRYWPGLIDEVAIYPLVLTPAQIAAHYQAGKGI